MNGKKEQIYWGSVFLYGMVLMAVLLYFRFPQDKFRQYCERLVEREFPQVSCMIKDVTYGFPAHIIFEEVRLSTKKNDNNLVFQDEQLVIRPVWNHLMNAIVVESNAYGGKHVLQVNFIEGGKKIELTNVQINEADLEQVEILQAGVDRKISGVLSGKGSVIFEKSPLAIAEAKGDVSIVRGEFELEQQILGLNVLRLQENSFSIKINQSTVEITQGKIKNSEINVDFQGNIQINKPLIASDINLSGSILPKTELFQKQPQVRDIVVRLQKRFKGDTLPFKVDGFIGQPTFVFQ